jgi:uncharacterized protein with ParB-like and HNH nuclease domain
MEYKNLDKNIKEILEDLYVVPLYQRNFAWGEDEIYQLLQDIYENFKKPSTGNYYIGSLVVFKRVDGSFEVIDGQQRLTTISLIAKFLDSSLTAPKLKYDSRPEVEFFLRSYFQNPTEINRSGDDTVSHFVQAVNAVQRVNVTPKTIEQTPLNTLDEKALSDFSEYFFDKVIIIRVEIPDHTDVAHYFEVMNNRGEQLQEHEILKARILEKEKDSQYFKMYAKIWDACSQMTQHVQNYFSPQERAALFGSAYNSFPYDLSQITPDAYDTTEAQTIDEILSDPVIIDNGNNQEEHKAAVQYNSVIDFPNFLMQVFKLKYSAVHQDIPLNADDLMRVYNALEKDIDAEDFIKDLLFYRTVFDRFIIKSLEDEKYEESFKWSLLKPELYQYDKNKSKRLIFKNAFDNQERIIKALSMLQVTFRTRKYKNWLQEVLSWFADGSCLKITNFDFLSKLDHLILSIYNKNRKLSSIIDQENYAEGTNTPHFLLNFIDYLMYVENIKKYNFEFKYRNSVEHHLPQSLEKKTNSLFVDNLGNLCLVGKSLNSKMNNESPVGKASKDSGKYYHRDLPPKQKEMYDLTNLKGKWTDEQILEHYRSTLDKLKNKENILKSPINELS